MASQGFNQIIAQQDIAGPLLNTYTTAKSVIDPTGLGKLKANQDLRLGRHFRTVVAGGLSNVVTAPGTITFQIMIAAVAAWSSGAIQLNASAHTLLPFELEIKWRLDSVGSGTTAKILGIGKLAGVMFTATAGQTDAVNTQGIFMVPQTAPAVGTGFDSTVDCALDFWAGWSLSAAGNGIQVYTSFTESLN